MGNLERERETIPDRRCGIPNDQPKMRAPVGGWGPLVTPEGTGMDAAFWQKQLDAFLAAPMPSLVFLALGAIAAWWLRGTVMQGELSAARERVTVVEERCGLLPNRSNWPRRCGNNWKPISL